MSKIYEIRAIGELEHDKEEGSRTVHGLAIPIESRSGMLYIKNKKIYETIERSAVNEELITDNDIKLYVNHDPSQGTFARSKYGEGSLNLMITDRGLEFTTELPKTQKGDELLQGIERGDYDAISFRMIVGKEHYDEKPNEDGSWNRYIDNIRWLDEISILSQRPAYSETNVDLRSLEAVEQEYEERQKEEASKAKEAVIEKLDSIMKEIEELAKTE